ncbi:hypothetical protein LINPERHAP1_LOCUS37633, partial [Linum perenne]
VFFFSEKPFPISQSRRRRRNSCPRRPLPDFHTHIDFPRECRRFSQAIRSDNTPNQAVDYKPYPAPFHRRSPGFIPSTNHITPTPAYFPLCRLDHQAAFHTRNKSVGESIPVCRLVPATVPTKLADLESLVVFSKSSL